MSEITTIPQLINHMWTTYSATLASGASNEIVVPVALKNIIGQQGISEIATRFRQLTQTGSVTTEDTDRGTVTIKIAPSLQGSLAGNAKPKNTPATTSGVPRPPNAFILYRQQNHPIVKAQNPNLHNTQISIILGTQWKNETEETKARFKSMAEALKQQHVRDHPGYQYQPRKPADRKRRMTRRKFAALAKMSAVPGITPVSTMAVPIEPFVEGEGAATLPEFGETKDGNVVLGLGAEAVGVGMFEQMLEQYNSNVQPLNHPNGQARVNDFSAVHSTGLFPEAIAERDFFASIWESDEMCKHKDELASEMDRTLKGCNTVSEMLTAAGIKDHTKSSFTNSLDLPSTENFDDSELGRMCNLWP